MKYRAGGRTIDKNHKLECYENPVVVLFWFKNM